jgi:hypothetical protein
MAWNNPVMIPASFIVTCQTTNAKVVLTMDWVEMLLILVLLMMLLMMTIVSER